MAMYKILAYSHMFTRVLYQFQTPNVPRFLDIKTSKLKRITGATSVSFQATFHIGRTPDYLQKTKRL